MGGEGAAPSGSKMEALKKRHAEVVAELKKADGEIKASKAKQLHAEKVLADHKAKETLSNRAAQTARANTITSKSMAAEDAKTMKMLGDLSATRLAKKASGRVDTLSKYQQTIKTMQATLDEAKRTSAMSGAGASAAALNMQVKAELKTIREKASEVKVKEETKLLQKKKKLMSQEATLSKKIGNVAKETATIKA